MTESSLLHCQQCGDITDERRIDGRMRPVCRKCGAVTYLDPKLAVAVVLQRAGKVLLGKRGPGAREAGKWSFPAGFVERGEVVEDAAIREVREEAGLLIELDGLVGLISTPGEVVVLAVYTGTVTGGSEAAGDDLTELGWFAPDALPELAFPHDRAILHQLTAKP